MNYDAAHYPATDTYAYIFFVASDGAAQSIVRWNMPGAITELRWMAEKAETTIKWANGTDWDNAKAFDLCARYEYHPGPDGGFFDCP